MKKINKNYYPCLVVKRALYLVHYPKARQHNSYNVSSKLAYISEQKLIKSVAWPQ